MIRRLPSKHRNAVIADERDRDAFVRLGVLLAIGLGLTSGFVYAGRQHFAALKYGYETEKLRHERDQLEEKQHRLIVEREEAASPTRLEQAATQLGMQPLHPAQIDPLRQGRIGPHPEKAARDRAYDESSTREPERNRKSTATKSQGNSRKTR